MADRACLAGSELLFPCVDSGYGKKSAKMSALVASDSNMRCPCKPGLFPGDEAGNVARVGRDAFGQ